MSPPFFGRFFCSGPLPLRMHVSRIFFVRTCAVCNGAVPGLGNFFCSSRSLEGVCCNTCNIFFCGNACKPVTRITAKKITRFFCTRLYHKKKIESHAFTIFLHTTPQKVNFQFA